MKELQSWSSHIFTTNDSFHVSHLAPFKIKILFNASAMKSQVAQSLKLSSVGDLDYITFSEAATNRQALDYTTIIHELYYSKLDKITLHYL